MLVLVTYSSVAEEGLPTSRLITFKPITRLGSARSSEEISAQTADVFSIQR